MTTSTGLTQADLDAYAAQLSAEKDRLDAYRAKLVKTAKKLQRQAARQSTSAPKSTTTSVPKPAGVSAPSTELGELGEDHHGIEAGARTQAGVRSGGEGRACPAVQHQVQLTARRRRALPSLTRERRRRASMTP